jgi:hypothetical protein
MPQTMIFPPLLAMIALVAAVWVRLYIDRISELRSQRIPLQDISTARQMAERMNNTNAADNFKNLFEMPVLFYVFCLTIFLVLHSFAWNKLTSIPAIHRTGDEQVFQPMIIVSEAIKILKR